MKTPTKAELYAQIEELQKANAKLMHQLEADKRARWEKLIPSAVEECHRKLHEVFPFAVCNLLFEHVDAAGYVFSFELVNDGRRQTYIVRHSDIGSEEV